MWDKTQILKQEAVTTLPLLLEIGMICIALKRALGESNQTGEQAKTQLFFHKLLLISHRESTFM